MTQDSNRSAQVPWGQRPPPQPQSQPIPWLGMLTVPALLAHIVVMLATTSVLLVVNLLSGPRVWWSLAIMVIWLALVIIHAIGVVSRSLLFVDDDDEAARPLPRARAEPIGPAVPGWLTLPKRNVAPDANVPDSWALEDDAPDPIRTSPATSANGEQPPAPTPPDEKVPWRAATDIAWLRRPKPPAASDAEPPASKEASS